jgi:hydroxymethylbilane synthase
MARAVDELLGWPPATAVVAFGPPSARALAALGVPVAATAQTQDPDGLIAAVASIRKDTR